MNTSGRPFRPIYFGLRLEATPPSYEVLFLAELDSDHRIAAVQFRDDPAVDPDPLRLGFVEFTRLQPDEIERLRMSAELVDRTQM
jgi:hypothetical protein